MQVVTLLIRIAYYVLLFSEPSSDTSIEQMNISPIDDYTLHNDEPNKYFSGLLLRKTGTQVKCDKSSSATGKDSHVPVQHNVGNASQLSTYPLQSICSAVFNAANRPSS